MANNNKEPKDDWQDIPHDDWVDTSGKADVGPADQGGGALETAGDFTRGAAQTASFGFADELTGALEAAAKAGAGKDELKDLLANYEKYRNESRTKYDQAKERSPYAYFGGELAGGLIPGMGAVKGGLTGATTLGQAIARAAGTGALSGAAFGAGSSEAQTLPELAKDTAMGGASGAVLGGTISGATGLASKGIKNLANKSGFIRDVIESAKRGVAGEDLVGPDARRATEKSLYDTSKEIQGMLGGEVNRGRGIKQGAIKEGESLGIKADIEDLLKEYEQKVQAAPERLPQQKQEKEQLLSLIRNELYGPEVEKQTIIPGKTSVIPGETIASGEDAATESLLQQQGKLGAKKELGEPQLSAEAKLKEKFATNEATSELPDLTKYRTPQKEMSSSGVETLGATGPEGNLMAQAIKDIKPGEIKKITDPKTGKTFMGFVDEATGKAYLEPIEDIAAQTPVKFRSTPEQVQKTTERTGGKTDMSPEELNQLINDFGETSKLGDESFKTQAISKHATDLTKDLKSILRGEQLGGLGEKVALGDKTMNAALDAQELLSRATSGLSKEDRVSMQKTFAETMKKVEQDTSAASSSRFIVQEALEGLKGTNPDLAKKIGDKIVDRATAYDLAKKIGAESAIQGRFIATAQGAALGAANVTGKALATPIKAAGNLATMAKTVTQNIKGFVNGSNPDTLKIAREALEAKGNVPQDLLEKLASAEQAPTNLARNSILFAIMQSPDYRRMLGISGGDK